MKNLANCKPSEFLKQTNRIKRAAEKWLTATDILNIRKRIPEIVLITEDMSAEEKRKAVKTNKERKDAQILKNLSDMFDAIADEHPDETLALLALMCFVEPEDVDNYPISDYLSAITEMLNDEAVHGFFTSFQRWGLLNT